MADFDVANGSIPADPAALLADFGRALSEVPFAEAREGCAAELGRLAPELDLSRIEIWRFNRPSNRAEQILVWAVDTEPSAPGLWVDAAVNERAEQAVGVSGRTAIVPRAWIDSGWEHRLGGESSQVVLSVIDHEETAESDATQTTVLIAVPTPQARLTLLSGPVSDVAVLLKQFNRRVRAQRRFERLLDVERTIGSASLMLADADADADTVATAMESVRTSLRAGALLLAEWHGGRVVELVAAAAETPIETPVRFEIPDVAGLDVDAAIVRRFGERSVGPTDGLISLALGLDAGEAFGKLGESPSAAMVPAGTNSRLSLGAIRSGDEPWDPGEIDALTAFGAVLGQARERQHGDEAAEFRRATSVFLSGLADDLADVDVFDAASVCADAAAAFGLQAGLDGVEVRWTGVPVLQPARWVDGERHDDHVRDSIPIPSDREILGEVEYTFAADRETRHGWRGFAAVLGQTEGRLRRDRDKMIADRAHASVLEAAELMARQGPEAIGAPLERVVELVGQTLPVQAVVLRSCDTTTESYALVASWIASPDIPAVPAAVAYGTTPALDEARVTGRITEDDGTTGTGPPRFVFPIGVHERVDLVLVAAPSPGDPLPDLTRSVLERLASLLSHSVGRIEAERYASMAFDHSPVGITVCTADGLALSVNQALVNLAGVASEADLIGAHFTDFLADPDGKIAWTESGEGRTARIRLRRPNGSRWLGQFDTRPVIGADPEQWLVHVTDVTNREQAERELRYAASHDALTGLPNRRALNEALSGIDPDATHRALLLLDLDRFKNVNDSLGHELGDELLVTVADRLRFSVRPGDLVARLGGDEFGILLGSVDDAVHAGLMAERVLRVLAEPATISGHRVYPSASIGIAIGAEGEDAFLREADIAMYQAKHAGGARYAVFDAELQRSVDERHRIEMGLRGAIADDRIEVWYQPEVDLRTGGILSAEALVRWRHPERGVIAAAEFIEVAEQSGLIQDIGLRVLDLACEEAATWPGGLSAPTVRVNLSAEQLHRDDLVETVTLALATHGLPARRLCLEITESAAMRDVDRSEEALHALRGLGVELAIDDFGTGYSSLAYLKRFPFHTLKIDRSFISDLERDPESVAFVGSIVSLADSLGLVVVAEGIETQAQAEALLELGCHRGQGYHYAKPAPASELRERIG